LQGLQGLQGWWFGGAVCGGVLRAAFGVVGECSGPGRHVSVPRAARLLIGFELRFAVADVAMFAAAGARTPTWRDPGLPLTDHACR